MVSGYWRDPRILPITNLVAVNEVSNQLREVGCYVAAVAVILVAR